MFARKIKQECPMRCYKVLLLSEDKELVSPYYKSTKWEIGETKTADNGAMENGIVKTYRDGLVNVNGGAFHTIKTFEDAQVYRVTHGIYCSEVLRKSEEKEYTPVIVECEIPADSKYTFEGKVIQGLEELAGYASEKLKPVEVVELLEN